MATLDQLKRVKRRFRSDEGGPLYLPAVGRWLIHPEKRRTYGQVSKVVKGGRFYYKTNQVHGTNLGKVYLSIGPLDPLALTAKGYRFSRNPEG